MIDKNQYVEQIKSLLSELEFPITVEVSGKDWVINISPSNVSLPPRCRKLIGMIPRQNKTLFSLPRNGFASCGVQKTDYFYGTSFTESGSYMLLNVEQKLSVRAIAEMIEAWLKNYVKSEGIKNLVGYGV